MLDYSLDQTSGILALEPKGSLTVDDFKALTADVDAYLAGHDYLTGILLTVAPRLGEFRSADPAHAVCARTPEAN